MGYAIVLLAIQSVNVVVVSIEKGRSDVKKVLKKRFFNQENKVILCSGIAPMAASYEADCWSGVCYSAGCYSMSC